MHGRCMGNNDPPTHACDAPVVVHGVAMLVVHASEWPVHEVSVCDTKVHHTKPRCPAQQDSKGRVRLVIGCIGAHASAAGTHLNRLRAEMSRSNVSIMMRSSVHPPLGLLHTLPPPSPARSISGKSEYLHKKQQRGSVTERVTPGRVHAYTCTQGRAQHRDRTHTRYALVLSRRG